MKSVLYFVLIASLAFSCAFARTAEEWKSRSVYQIITDRFAQDTENPSVCTDLNKYCGGTFNGIRRHLDYIQGMGFNAIWISPIVANTEHGYHGYWASDLYKINEHFGTEEELIELINECHSRDIWVMVDVVANHMGYLGWDNGHVYNSTVYPFTDKAHYNEYVECNEFDSADPAQFDHVERCWLSGLPDLNQNHPFVRSTLLKWAKDIVATYNIDALRIDTIPHVKKDFWAEFSKEAGVYTIGEALSFNMQFIASFQGAVDGVLNYALFIAMRDAFMQGKSMNEFQHYYDAAASTWADISILGNFVNNHDNARFLSISDNRNNFKAALAFSIASVGIPMVYYGDEQFFNGGQDPLNREAFFTNMNTESEVYKFLATINAFRKTSGYYAHPQVQRYSDDHFYGFTRGDAFFAFTNSQDTQTRTITYHPYQDGTKLCNIFYKDDCVSVENGSFNVVLLNGEVKMFSPVRAEDQAATERNSVADELRTAAMSAISQVSSM